MKPETIYTTPWSPDLNNAKDVLAFLLIPTSAFIDPDDCQATRIAVEATMRRAKQDALLQWYAGRRL